LPRLGKKVSFCPIALKTGEELSETLESGGLGTHTLRLRCKSGLLFSKKDQRMPPMLGKGVEWSWVENEHGVQQREEGCGRARLGLTIGQANSRVMRRIPWGVRKGGRFGKGDIGYRSREDHPAVSRSPQGQRHAVQSAWMVCRRGTLR